MRDELVLDASAAAKIFITEPGSDAARALVGSGFRVVAPELVLIELTNVAVKRQRRGDISRTFAAEIVAAARGVFDELIPAVELFERAFVLAVDHGLSTYDSMYVALAQARGCNLVTADTRLVSRARRAELDIRFREL